MGKNFKNFQFFFINSKKFKNSKSFEIFTHWSSKIPTRILGALSGEIRHRFFQVTPHVLLILFHANFFNFHGQFLFFVQSKIGISAHADIRVFSMYMAAHTRKNLPKPRTYMVVLRTVTYAAVHKDF